MLVKNEFAISISTRGKPLKSVSLKRTDSKLLLLEISKSLKNKKSKSRRMPKMCAIPQLVSAQL